MRPPMHRMRLRGGMAHLPGCWLRWACGLPQSLPRLPCGWPLHPIPSCGKMSDVDTWENPVADPEGGRGAEPSLVGAVTKWVFCARVPVDDPQPTASASKQAGGARSSAPQKKRPAARTGQPVARQYGSKEDMWASTRRLAEAAGGADDDIYAETARLAESKDNLEAARSQLEKMEQRFATQRAQMANELMKLNARAREDDAALRECREQLRTRDSTMSKLEAALKQEQQAKAALNEQLAKAKGMLEGANMRALAAQKAQVLLAKNLMEDMDSLDQVHRGYIPTPFHTRHWVQPIARASSGPATAVVLRAPHHQPSLSFGRWGRS
jgi:hypothetical protein